MEWNLSSQQFRDCRDQSRSLMASSLRVIMQQRWSRKNSAKWRLICPTRRLRCRQPINKKFDDFESSSDSFSFCRRKRWNFIRKFLLAQSSSYFDCQLLDPILSSGFGLHICVPRIVILVWSNASRQADLLKLETRRHLECYCLALHVRSINLCTRIGFPSIAWRFVSHMMSPRKRSSKKRTQNKWANYPCNSPTCNIASINYNFFSLPPSDETSFRT